jgi:hypothetical protein
MDIHFRHPPASGVIMPAKIYCYENDPEVKQYWFHCPGCGNDHAFTVGPQKEGWGDARWNWNGSWDSPTFSPSLMCNPDYLDSRCHAVVTDGKIAFQGDCHHDLRGQTVDMPDWDS